MSILWGDFQRHILEGLLKDAEGVRYTPEQMLVYIRWALSEVSNHTACADMYYWDGDGQTKQFVLPANMIGSIEKCGLVALVNGPTADYLPPYKNLPATKTTWPTINSPNSIKVYWEWPSGKLTLGVPPSTSEKLCLYYFRIWDIPIDDNSILNIPRWMEQPVALLCAAAALEPISTQYANINQWRRKTDSGTPEHNPAEKQARWFIENAHRILNQTAPQDRETFYLNDPRISMRK